MNHEKITFIQAENGIIVEIHEKNWDGHSVIRKLFPKSEYKDSYEMYSKAIQYAFPTLEITP